MLLLLSWLGLLLLLLLLLSLSLMLLFGLPFYSLLSDLPTSLPLPFVVIILKALCMGFSTPSQASAAL